MKYVAILYLEIYAFNAKIFMVYKYIVYEYIYWV